MEHLTSTAMWWATAPDVQGSGAQDPAARLVFTNAPGTVVVDGTVTAGAGLTFSADGYTLNSGSSSPNINLAGASLAANTITVDAAVTAGIGVALTGTNGMTKAGDGRLNLTAAPGYTGATLVNAGILGLAAAGLDDAADVKIKSAATMNLGFGGVDTVGALYLNNVLRDGGSYNATTAPGYFTGTGSLTVPVTARNFGVSGTWFGDWNVAANWVTSGFIPNGAGKWAVFPVSTSDARMAVTNVPVTLGRLDLLSTGPVAITGLQPNGTLTMQVDPYLGGTAQINVAGATTHKINLPLTFADNTAIDVADFTTLTIGNPATINPGKTVSKTGLGTLRIEAPLTGGTVGGLAIEGGLLEVAKDLDVSSISGGGSTSVLPGASLNVGSIMQDTLTIGSGATLTIRPTTAGDFMGVSGGATGPSQVPEPAAWVLLVTALAGLWALRRGG